MRIIKLKYNKNKGLSDEKATEKALLEIDDFIKFDLQYLTVGFGNEIYIDVWRHYLVLNFDKFDNSIIELDINGKTGKINEYGSVVSTSAGFWDQYATVFEHLQIKKEISRASLSIRKKKGYKIKSDL